MYHRRTNAQDKTYMQYQCGKCNKYLSCNSNLKSQIRKPTEEKPRQFNQ